VNAQNGGVGLRGRAKGWIGIEPNRFNPSNCK